ncbi:MAG: HPP family protein [Sulfuricellaceae bacterium]|nr:HPP family protein [Sulfuricellaceae bacterium]
MSIRSRLSFFFPIQVTVSHKEKIFSALAAFAVIVLVALVSHHFLEPEHLPYLAASMGASTVLLLAAPHSPFSQPWPLLGGHLIAALIGITCAKFVPNIYLAAALAVSLTVLAMFYLRCIHPPGGGTALLVVIGGVKITELGYLFAFTPVLLNAALLLTVALLANRLIPGRHYPYNLSLPTTPAAKDPRKDNLGFSHQDLLDALQDIDGYIDVTGEDLERIYALATEHAKKRRNTEKS